MACSWTSRPPGPSRLPSFELLFESDGITGLDSMEGEGRGLRGSTTSKLHHTHSQVLKHKRNTAKGPPPVQPSPSFQHVPGAFSRPLLAGEGLGRSVLVIVKLKNKGHCLVRSVTGSEASRKHTSQSINPVWEAERTGCL